MLPILGGGHSRWQQLTSQCLYWWQGREWTDQSSSSLVLFLTGRHLMPSIVPEKNRTDSGQRNPGSWENLELDEDSFPLMESDICSIVANPTGPLLWPWVNHTSVKAKCLRQTLFTKTLVNRIPGGFSSISCICVLSRSPGSSSYLHH